MPNHPLGVVPGRRHETTQRQASIALSTIVGHGRDRSYPMSLRDSSAVLLTELLQSRSCPADLHLLTPDGDLPILCGSAAQRTASHCGSTGRQSGDGCRMAALKSR